jgi:hypothetical protein
VPPSGASSLAAAPSLSVQLPSADAGVEALLGLPDAAFEASPPSGEALPHNAPLPAGRPADPAGDPQPLFDATKAAEAPAGKTSLRATPAIVSAANSVPDTPTPLAAPSNAAPSGEHFMDWLRQGILTRKLIINDAKALAHTVDGTACLVTPGVFQRYAQEHLKVASLARLEGMTDWQWVQKRFEKLGLHRKQTNGLNIWTCEVTGPRKSRRLHGYLLQDPKCLFNEIPPNNPYLTLCLENGD